MGENQLAALPGLLLGWYEANRRDLPWRSDREPYHIWVSEIMLQQTRVEAVKGYYTRFLEKLPDIQALAQCDDDTLHKLWEGLGYYSRVRNLKKAARVILEKHEGRFPEDYQAILALPGIGEYTAGAISSIAFGQRRAAVDGNVLRVMARLRGDDTPVDLPECKSRVRQALEEIYPEEAGAFTQALMELGATVCLPNGEPKCGQCPCAAICLGRERWRELPVKLPKKAKKEQERTVFVLSQGGRYAIERRPGKGLLAGLWQFPNVEGTLEAEQVLAWAEQAGLAPRELERKVDRSHIFTHIKWVMRGWYLEVDNPIPAYTWMTPEEIEVQAALPTAFRQFWEEIRENV
ncbi:MAG: A/G-specific adenine glycosylase [Oscillospiraceae bacterium]|nr:A/G-specific adenine glycosylase [Oscillospiraceae bacterium]